jgi:nucleoside-diphosphate-sugar epimerase
MIIGVSGGAGFIGSAVRRLLEARGDTMVSFDHPLDVRAYSTVLHFASGVDGVINLAGILGTAETIDNEGPSIAVNIQGALNVADACRFHDIPMVQIGTGHRGQLNPYAVTKACAEDLVLTRAMWSGLKANVVRAFHAYGPGQKAPPPYGTATVRKIIPSFVCAAIRQDPLIVNGTGLQRIDLVHVDDVAAALVEGLGYPYGRTLEAGTGTDVSVQDAARDVVAAVGTHTTIRYVPMRPGEPTYSEVFAKEPAVPARPWPSLDDTIAYYREMLA